MALAASLLCAAVCLSAQDDPSGTVILKLSNRFAGENSFCPADFTDEAIVMTRENNLSSENGGWEFALFGPVNGLAYIQRIPESGWASRIALKPETGYVARIQKGFTNWDNMVEPNYVYVGIYCVGWRTAAGDDGGIIGANLKYVCPFRPEIPACTSGMPSFWEWSFRAILASKESRQSTITSHPANISPLSAVTGSQIASTSAAGFRASIHSAEITDLGRGSPAE